MLVSLAVVFAALLAKEVSAVAVGNNLPLRSLLHVRQDQVIDPNEIAPEAGLRMPPFKNKLNKH
ncbi:hypothetical protein PHLCEN_2v9709 [Hermanssonia centrifuga]|uniref:Uncharacterized protein n=1 Tax=Hermanssonia centrifuga TaxID=98765 RepID=A0A2R6NPU8_9APHY|nr:hypothetical protein PHLCEN_2v9709 [Hermanssonia centrifuga]